MTRSRIIVVAMLSVALVCGTTGSEASAQELNFATISRDEPNIVTAGLGVDSALVYDFGYRRVVDVGGRRSIIGVDLVWPGAELDSGDYRLSAGISLPLANGDHWKLIARLSPTLRSTESSLNRMVAVGADTRLVGGYYAAGWFAALEAGVDRVAAAHIRHSDEYREVVYADAKDGWYRNTGGTLYAGLQGGPSFSRVDVVLRLGAQHAATMDPKTLPFFAMLGANVTLPN